MGTIGVGVFDEHEVFRRGILACLAEDPNVELIEITDPNAIPPDIAVMVVSGEVAARTEIDRPTVVCFASDEVARQLADRHEVFAVLPRRSVTPDQLVASVHAAAVGLHVNCDDSVPERVLSDRGRGVLDMLSRGADTREIATKLGYSERTIKAALAEAQSLLGTRNRTHAVAEAVRSNLI